MRKRVARVAVAMNAESAGGRIVIRARNVVMVTNPATLIEKYGYEATMMPMETGFNDGNR